MDSRWQLTFYGEVIGERRIEDVRRNFAQQFNLDDARIEAIFSGQGVVLKRNLSQADAQRYVTHLASLGARVHLQPMADATATPPPPPSQSLPMPWQDEQGPDTIPVQPRMEPLRPSPRVAPPAPPAVPPAKPTTSLPLDTPTPTSPGSLGSAPVPLGPSSSRASAPVPLGPTPPSIPSRSAPAPATTAAAPSRFGASTAPLAIPPSRGESTARLIQISCPRCGEIQPPTSACRNCGTTLDMGTRSRFETQSPLGHEPANRPSPTLEQLEPDRRESGYGASQPAEATTDRTAPSATVGGRTSSFEPSRHGRTSRLPRTAEPADTGDAPPLWGWGWSGRLGRLNYATGIFAIAAVMSLVEILTHRMPMMVSATITLAAVIPLVVQSFRQSALRLHDRGHSGWWNLMVLLPIATAALMVVTRAGLILTGVAVLGLLAMALYLLFFPGDADTNLYGDPPREGNLGILLAAIAAAVLFGWFSPERGALPGRGLPEMRGSTAPRAGGTADPATRILKSNEAKRVYATDYATAPKSKAFAASPDGAWGWKSDATSADAAMSEATRNCETHRRTDQRPCQIINVDGRPVP